MGLTVVTGASGHLGINVLRGLLARGRQVRAIVHADSRALAGFDVVAPRHGIARGDVEIVPGDIIDKASLVAAFRGAQSVIHCAGYVSVRPGDWSRLKAINADGVANVVQACRAAGVQRLVHFSSIEALVDRPLGAPIDESRSLVSQDATAYARSKALGERHVWQAVSEGYDAVVINPTAMLGPFDYRTGHPNAGLLWMCRGRLPVMLDAGFDWVDVRDVAEGALAAETLAMPGSRYILSGHWASMRDLRALGQEITGVSMPRLTCPMWLASVAAPFANGWARVAGERVLFTGAALKPLQSNARISHERATQDLNYLPRPLQETVVDTLNWFARSR